MLISTIELDKLRTTVKVPILSSKVLICLNYKLHPTYYGLFVKRISTKENPEKFTSNLLQSQAAKIEAYLAVEEFSQEDLQKQNPKNENVLVYIMFL